MNQDHTHNTNFFLRLQIVTKIIGIIFLSYTFFSGFPAHAATPLTVTDQPWHVSADHLNFSRPENLYTASGNVTITSGTRRLSADIIYFNAQTMRASAIGHVIFSSGQDRISGDRMKMDLISGTGIIENGDIFIKKNHFFIQGDKIEKTGAATYQIKNASLTACEGPDPAWHITGKNIEVAIGGFGTMRDAKFWIKKLPAFYLPIFRFPILRERQSGFLLPEYGYSSRMGARFIVPFFWSINESTDATLYFENLQRRGIKGGVEFRYAGAKGSKLTLLADGLSDHHVDNNADGSTSQWGYSDDTAMRPNSGRYWFRMKTDHNFSETLSAKLDLDIVSDQDYLKDFDDGAIGYNNTSAAFERRFGRGIDDKNDPVRRNYFNINRRWTSFSFNGDVLWHDDVIKRRFSDNDDTLQRLPSLTMDSLKQPLFGSPLFYTINLDYAYLYKKEGEKGHRTVVHPKIYLPIHAVPWMTIEPYAGFYQTDWYRDSENSGQPDQKNLYHNQRYELGGEISSEVSRVYSGNRDKKLRHIIIPRLGYAYTPDALDKDYPQFDDQTPVISENIVSLSVTHIFISKTILDQPGTHDRRALYHERCRFFIEQAYDLSLRKNPDEALLPLYAELDLKPFDMLSIRTDGKYNHDKNRLDSSNISFLLEDCEMRLLRLDYRYTATLNNSVFTQIRIPVSAAWTVFGDYERNIADHLDVRTSAGVHYDARCWAFTLSYINEQNDQKIAATIKLAGLDTFNEP